MSNKAQIEFKNKIGKWYNVDKEVYVIIFELAKQRLDDLLDETESVTSKSIKITTGLFAFVGVFAGYLSANEKYIVDNTSLLTWSCLPVFVNIVLLVWLILPKNTANKGLAPEVALVDNFDSPEDSKNQMQLLYYNCIVVLQDNIDETVKRNQSRSKIYVAALCLSLGLIVYIPAITIYVILNRS